MWSDLNNISFAFFFRLESILFVLTMTCKFGIVTVTEKAVAAYSHLFEERPNNFLYLEQDQLHIILNDLATVLNTTVKPWNRKTKTCCGTLFLEKNLSSLDVMIRKVMRLVVRVE